ncbi:MAG: restriction endonuclease subunit S [Gallionella sp.]|nr:restriction endonuclease subunit S [Gallionella sp.]MDP1941735.1 restriction endonuclease subunit S [Gallionella sp.]
MSWHQARLSDISEVVTGSTPSTFNVDYYGGDIPFITPTQLNKEIYVGDSATYVTQAGAKAARLIPKNSVMVCCIGSLGKIGISSRPLITNQQINSLVINENIADPLYVYFYCRTLSNVLENMAPKTTVAIVNKSRFSELTIPLPSLATQKHIARVLEQAYQLRKQAQQMKNELNQLAQSLFLEMFGDPIKNPKGWVKVPISHFVDEFEGGKSVAAAGDESAASKFRVLKISAVTWREFNPSESKPLPEEYQPVSSHFVRKGDLLFSRANTTELVGATSYVFEEYDNLLLPDKLWRFVWKNDVELSPMFIWNLFMDPSFRIELGKLSSGSGGSMKNISKGKLLPFEVIFPPSEMQKSFEKKFLKIRDEILACRRKAAECNAIFESLMQRAFNGELTAPARKAG